MSTKQIDGQTSKKKKQVPRYSIGIWDVDVQSYVPFRGSQPAFNVTLRQLRIAMRELRNMQYSVHRRRDADGTYDDNDPAILIERTDGKHWKKITSLWYR